VEKVEKGEKTNGKSHESKSENLVNTSNISSDSGGYFGSHLGCNGNLPIPGLPAGLSL
jgi:hypothetical protein